MNEWNIFNMKILGLLRHAKSSWAEPGMPDHARPLNERGRAAALALGPVLAAQDPAFDLVMCSDAARTRETLALACIRWNAPAMHFENRLYHADAGDLLAEAQQLDDALNTVLFIGHNPGLHDAALWLTRRGPADVQHRLAEKLPSGGLVILQFAVTGWRAVKPETGTLKQFITPRDLAGQG